MAILSLLYTTHILSKLSSKPHILYALPAGKCWGVMNGLWRSTQSSLLNSVPATIKL